MPVGGQLLQEHIGALWAGGVMREGWAGNGEGLYWGMKRGGDGLYPDRNGGSGSPFLSQFLALFSQYWTAQTFTSDFTIMNLSSSIVAPGAYPWGRGMCILARSQHRKLQ